MTDTERLRRLLGKPDLAWLLARLRRRLELGQPLAGTVTLSTATPDQRRAVELLLGRRAGRGTSVSVSLDDLDTMLRESGAAPTGLADAVRAVLGDIPDRAGRQAQARAAWSAAHAPLDELVDQRPALRPWREWLDSTGLVRRLTADPTAAASLLADAARVLAALPAAGLALGRLAAAAVGDAHALDDGRPLATLVLSAARVLMGSAPGGGGTAADRRAAWAAVGVHLDELSSSVLCVGLPGGTGSATARILALAGEAGEPSLLTLRQLRPGLGVGDRLVWLCENPIVVATAADELGPRCPPLVCLNGQPSTAVTRLLGFLAEEGARFTYHGDFDWGGLRIANTLAGHIPWRPWRFDAPAYQQALARVPGAGILTGRPVSASWDPDLAPAMSHAGRQVEEELLLPDLIADLAAAR
ncbi:TIGR02679 family protein [Actinokineospora iranica]|uniref:TIGR02679 family protein n=1 Tax=Actinokineospora iranica TaxID=1271860 RepID=A0A1G6X5X5_9PSEU|nr:TIGR02679 family protein [Actinokineospora iranica]SDD73528.1 TIGR02679 family protein [Actinokineospora iranica]